MATTQYIGAKYVPHGWEDWNQNTYYDGLFCVNYNYSWFISKKNVPAGISPVNTEYWAPYSLTTGGQQELVDLVNRYDPKTPIPPNYDFNRIISPGTYFLKKNSNYVNAPFNNNNGSMTVRKISDQSDAVIQRVESAGAYPTTYQRTVSTNFEEEWFVVENSQALDYYNFNGPWINNVDVFNTIVSESKTKWYKFGTGCSNTPSMGNYFTVIQVSGQAFAFGGIGSKNTVSMSYWDSNTNTWIGWQNIPNSSYMNNLGFYNMLITPVRTEESNGYYYYHFWKNNINNVVRSTLLVAINDSGGHGRIDFVLVKTESVNSSKIAGEDGISAEYLIGNKGEIIIKSTDQYLAVRAISTNEMYGAKENLSPIFNTFHNPYTMPINNGYPLTIPEDGSNIPVNIPDIT